MTEQEPRGQATSSDPVPVAEPAGNGAPLLAAAPTTPRPRRRWWLILVAMVAFEAAIWGRSYLGAQSPIRDAVAKDARNSGVELSAHYAGYWNSSVLILDLVRADGVAPADLFRVLFQAAGAMHAREARFENVQLARRGELVFVLDGADFATLGSEFAGSENPLFMIRTLPTKLKRPSGSPAFSKWTGGWLGVMTRETQDANTAAGEWVAGTASP